MQQLSEPMRLSPTPSTAAAEWSSWSRSGELWRYRRFIWETAVSDLRYRYAGSSLGVFWNVLTPLAMLALYTFIFTRVLEGRTPATATTALFVLYLGSGFLPWGTFVDNVTRGTQALLANAVYLRKMAIPEEVFVAQVAVSATLSMLIVMGLLMGLAAFLGQPLQRAWLLLPVVAFLWQLLGFGLALILGTLNVFFRDITHMLGVGFQIWMWSLPVVYLEELLPSGYRLLLALNPAYPFLRAIRDLYLDGAMPAPWTWAAMGGWAALVGLAGMILVRALRSEIRDAL